MIKTIKKLLFFTLLFGTMCSHADGWLYRAYAGLFGRQSKQQSNNKTSWKKVAGITAGVTGFGLLAWLGWKKYSARKATEWTVAEMDDAQEIAKQQGFAKIDADLLEKKQQALKTAKEEYAAKVRAVNTTQTTIDDLDVQIEIVAKGRYDLVQQKRAAYVTNLANNKVAELEAKSDYLIMDSDRPLLQTQWEKHYSDIISQGAPMNPEWTELSNILNKDTELKAYDATKLTPLDNEKKKLKMRYQSLKSSSDKLAQDVKQAHLEKFFGEDSTELSKDYKSGFQVKID
jgi:hypothetical protein